MTSRAPADALFLDDLGLGGDGDDAEIIRDVEHATGMAFGAVPRSWTTVGDMEDAVLAQFPATTGQGRCASMMAFHVLRAALRREPGVRQAILPSTKFRDLGVRRMRRFLASLEAETGMRLRRPGWSLVGGAGLAMVVAGIVAPIAIGALWPVLAVVLGVLLMHADPGSFGGATIGRLAADAADRNHALFARRGADTRPGTIRAVLRRLAGQVACVPPERIGPSTRFFPR